MWDDEFKRKVLHTIFMLTVLPSGIVVAGIVITFIENGAMLMPLIFSLLYLLVVISSGLGYHRVDERIYINARERRQVLRANGNINNFDSYSNQSNPAFSSNEITKMEKEMSKMIKDGTKRN